MDLHSHKGCSESWPKPLHLEIFPDKNDHFHWLSAEVSLPSSQVLCGIKRKQGFGSQNFGESPIACTDINLVPSCIFPGCWIKYSLLNVSQSMRQQGRPPCQPGCTRGWYQGGLPGVSWHWSSFPGLNFGPMLYTWKHCHSWVNWAAFHDFSWDWSPVAEWKGPAEAVNYHTPPAALPGGCLCSCPESSPGESTAWRWCVLNSTHDSIYTQVLVCPKCCSLSCFVMAAGVGVNTL